MRFGEATALESGVASAERQSLATPANHRSALRPAVPTSHRFSQSPQQWHSLPLQIFSPILFGFDAFDCGIGIELVKNRHVLVAFAEKERGLPPFYAKHF